MQLSPKYVSAGLILLTLSGVASVAAQDANTFPFVLPWDDSSKTAIDVSDLNPAPIGEMQRISVRDGHFFDATGRRVRLLGVNFVFAANSMDKEAAPKIAARLHKLGVNIVRLHHMDTVRAPNGLISGKTPDSQHIDPDQLDKLEFLVAQFKQNGIYVDLNLHVGRTFNDADGFPERWQLPQASKGILWFDQHMIELQQQYARDILNHVNPYTKMRWADDPVLALVEINNEDTTLGPGRAVMMRKLPDKYRQPIEKGWNDFLRAKYKTTDAMLRVWNDSTHPDGDNLLTNGRFEDGKMGWNLEAPAPAQAELGTEPVAGDEKPLPEGQSLHLKLAQPGTDTTPVQVTRGGLSLTRGTLYRVQFWAKSSVAARAMQVNMRLGQAPWTALGLMENVQVTDKWQPFNLTFTSPADIQEKARLAFTLTGKEAGDLFLANVKFSVAGDRVDLADRQTLEAGNLEVPRVGANRQGADFLAFQMELEKKYVDTMTDTIKKELGSKAMVTCSQDGWGGLGGVLRESRTDYVDMHAYWQHPEFPNNDWSRSNWVIGNSPLVKSGDGGTMSELAMHRVEGKPFTVSEYNHPAPSDYACETVPFLAAFAAWQDWDGIFLFDYTGNASTKRLDKVNTWFSVETDSNKTTYLPAAARLFLGGQMASAATPLTFVVPKGQIPGVSAKNGLSVSTNWYKSGVNRKDILKYRDAIRLVDGNGDLSVEKPGEPAAAPSFLWFTDRPAESYFRVSSPDTRWLVGYPSARWQNVDGLSVTAEPTKFGLVALGLTARDGKAIADSGSLLLTIGTHFENQNMGWNDKRNSVGEKWGDGPMMGEGVKASISVDTHAKVATVYALDVTGARNGTVPSKLEGGKLSFNPSPEYKTVWYEIELK